MVTFFIALLLSRVSRLAQVKSQLLLFACLYLGRLGRLWRSATALRTLTLGLTAFLNRYKNTKVENSFKIQRITTRPHPSSKV